MDEYIAFLPIEEPPPLGNNGGQPDQSAFEVDWVPDPARNIYQLLAPHAPCADGPDCHDDYPLSDPGPLSLLDGSPIQRPAPDKIPEGVWEPNLDFLNTIDTGTGDSGYGTSTQPTNPHIALAPDNYHTPIFSLQSQGVPPQYLQTLYMSPSAHAPGDNVRQQLEHLQPNIVPLQSRTLRQAVPSVVTGKRSREAQASHSLSASELPRRSAKAARVDAQLERPRRNGRRSPNVSHTQSTTNSSSLQEIRVSNHPTSFQAETCKLTKKQKMFIRQWKNLAKQESLPFLAHEEVNALATLMGVPPQPVLEYIHRKFIAPSAAQSTNNFQLPQSHTLPKPQPSSTSGYSFREANQHMPAATLESAENYVFACHRRRPQSDGRRTINDGPFRCTYGCGYRTKRPFDWKRHEETHEPQELWLCHLCVQNDDQNPFLVNRKDKFLGHIKGSHKGWEPEKILNMSKLKFNADFNPRCPFCSDEISTSWEERCKHIIAHYEDEIHNGSRETHGRSKSLERVENTSDEEGSNLDNGSDSTDSSDDEDNDQDGPDHSGSNRGAPTGGSGGGSGSSSGPPTYRGSGTGQGGGAVEDSDSYGSYSGMGFVFSQKKSTGLVFDWEEPTKMRKEVVLHTDFSKQRLAYTKGGLHRSLNFPSYNLNCKQIFSSTADTIQRPGRQQLGASLAFLGHGSHGSVDTVQEYVSGRVYARKRSMHRHFFREIEILRSLSHPHIVKFVAAYRQNSSLHLVMSPIAQLTLQDWFLVAPDKDEYDLHRAHTWIGCLSSALSYIHSKNIRHADLSPKNILLKGSEIFITDFGISRPVSESDSTSSSISPSTPLYAPLEIAEHLPHGRKADIFSLGCVVLEVLSFVQGKSYKDLHRHLGFTKRKRHAPRDPLAYYKAHGKLLSWISMMRRHATTTTRKLWDICECMIQNRIDLRPSATLLLEQVRQALQEGNAITCPTCTFGPSRIEELDATDLNESAIPLSSPHSRPYQASQETDPLKLSIYGNSASCSQTAKSGEEAEVEKQKDTPADSCLVSTRQNPSTYACVCIIKKKRSSALLGLFDILAEYECPTLDIEIPNLVTDVFAVQIPPPAYDSSFYPVSISGPTGPSQPQAVVHVAEITDNLGKVGMKYGHGTRLPGPPSVLAHCLCHRCGRRLVAPRLDQCRCSHIRCSKCTFVRLVPSSRTENDLVGIGGHLQPPAYSFQDILGGVSTGDPLTELHTENTVLNLVIAENTNLGNSVEERFIEERPSTFDRIHLRAQNPNSSLLSQSSSFSSVVDSRLRHQGSYSDASASTSSTSSTSLSSASPQSKRAKLDNHKRLRLGRRQNRQFISGRSKQSVHIKKPQAMNDHATANNLDSRDLTSRLQRIQKSSSTPNDGDYVSRITRTGTTGTTSSDDSANAVFSRLPAFRKSKTSSTTGSNEVSSLEVVRTFPTSATNRESVEVDAGEFSKPSIRRRRGTNESSKSHKEFQYYGRHANSWLFNDFSISGHVKKGWGKVFSPKSEGEE